MSWRAVGDSVPGTSHLSAGLNCDDAYAYVTVTDEYDNEIFIACVSDGAGSALMGGWAAEYIVNRAVDELVDNILDTRNEDYYKSLLSLLYSELLQISQSEQLAVSEYSATFLLAVVYDDMAVFLQIGDGVIIFKTTIDENYSIAIWPANGEYLNTTNYLIDDASFAQASILTYTGRVTDLAISTDGLQQLIINYAEKTVHQPFFDSLFKPLYIATDDVQLDILQNKLSKYLSSDIINSRTDDDKTLLIATSM